ncbi:MAG: hypothetical protein HYZ50_06530 [Deltaproteobacteria bacterium]|nr:hypothetical protein [Deltaproteobacteria bacterium]
MADKEAERLKFQTEILRFIVLAVFAIGGGSLGLLLGERTAFRVSLAIGGLFVTLGLLIVGWRQGRRIHQLVEQMKESP